MFSNSDTNTLVDKLKVEGKKIAVTTNLKKEAFAFLNEVLRSQIISETERKAIFAILIFDFFG